ncbi:hypothetical protein [Burkholderia stagnalis]|uniref:hypothetical protein n=1 Tax=Burkholderia stagnalis TaxID=1503054 RepID=UPI0012D9337C|nr:hypothetical protein [Burkholderia stagnalis]
MSKLGNHAKPKFGESCNGCGYCCTVGPCMLAQEFLHCMTGPCVALEVQDGRTVCGLVRNPLGYLFQAAHPAESVSVLEAPPSIDLGHRLSVEFAAALGLGEGCDADDDDESAAWSARNSTRQSG